MATLGAIFQARIDSQIAELAPRAPSAFADAVSSGAADRALAAVPPQFRAQAAAAANQAFVSALNEILLMGALIAFAGGALGLLLVRRRDFVGAPSVQPAPPEAEDATRPLEERAAA